VEEVSADSYYGKDYQDMPIRVPDIAKAKTILGWEPKVTLKDALHQIIHHYVHKSTQEIDQDLGR
jgi:nucleoside-diphosphate-sugar epimerase